MKHRARALMVLGTGSHVGKSVLVAALGRIFCDDGVRVAPFKAQNMALNSAATPEGGEIGRAQALQAEACRVAPRVEMNPVLIKPSSETGAQVVVLGKVWGQVTASDYHRKRVDELFPLVVESYGKLAAEYDLIVLEGAGSPAEINLKARDIVNLRMAQAADAACLLVGDIDRGGVFASLFGTMALLEDEERALIRGFAINKFRGDLGLLEPGVRMMEERIERPCAGVIPYLRDLGLDEEDGVALEDRRTVGRVWAGDDEKRLRVGVIALPHMSNFTDFDPLAREPEVALAYLEKAEDVERAHVLVLPGTKQTLDDLHWLEVTGFAEAVRSFKGPILGICGGMQMLGKEVCDPDGVESGGRAREARGLALLSIKTLMRGEKAVRQVSAVCDWGRFTGYEIHMGETIRGEGVGAFAGQDGAVSPDGRMVGTYVHGLLDEDEVRHNWIQRMRESCGLPPARTLARVKADREGRIDRLASHVRAALDMKMIRGWLSTPIRNYGDVKKWGQA
jgi:adenosylcobyric acid synthase